MGVLIEPTIEIKDIVIEVDKNNANVENALNEWGKNIPVISINDYVIGMGDLQSLNLRVALNSLPTFSMMVNDSDLQIREALKNDLDTCIIFIGYKEWYIKFNGIINTCLCDIGDNMLRLEGNFYQEKLLESEQFIYNDMTIQDILLDVCQKSGMGLFTYDNEDLSQTLDFCINPGMRYIDFIDYIVRKYTKNIYSYDTNGYLIIGSIDKIKASEIATYTLNNKGEKIQESPIIFLSKYVRKKETDPEDDLKIDVEYYTHETNYSSAQNNNFNKFLLNTEEKEIRPEVGLGMVSTNTYSEFVKSKNPFYRLTVNKLLAGNITKIQLKYLMFELLLFDTVEIEFYLPQTPSKEHRLDHQSGKKNVIGFTINYNNDVGEGENTLARITQQIELI